MPNPLARARWLAPVFCLALTAAVLAMGDHRGLQARLVARQAAMDPPRLWLAESLDPAGARTGATMVCADQTLRDGFGRANIEADDGRPCVARRAGVERTGVYANRCELEGHRFGVTVNRAGDPMRDFTVAIAFTALDGTEAKVRQVRRFRDVGPCPAGWSIGDQARPGQRRSFSAVKGTWGA